MTAAELIDYEFFAPASTDMVDGMVARYKQARERIDRVAEIMEGELGGVIRYFADGNKTDRDRWYGLEKLFHREGAIGALNSQYWSDALRLTDVLDCMPQKRRDEWFDLIKNHKTPDFEESTVRDTIGGLLAMRSQFFAERVDGIFRSLSGAHVTNQPQGFGKRMIISGVIDSIGLVNSSKAAHINDLRCVVAKFMGREEPKYWGGTDSIIRMARGRSGEWMQVDGNALRIRVYAGVGTAHLEVHSDMAWRLNGVLASLYPAAIPPKFRQRPARKAKEHALIQRPLPFVVLEVLAGLKEARDRNPVRGFREDTFIKVPGCFDMLPVNEASKHVMAEAGRALESIGGVNVSAYRWTFGYDPRTVINEIVCNGCIPDDKSHQFYPTPDNLARKVIELAEINESHTVLEPSAGAGALADAVPSCKHLTCIEVSKLRAEVLQAKGHYVVVGDFLKHPDKGGFDRVVMNPPFSDGRWQAHVQAAAEQVTNGGRLVSILPASARGKDILPGWSCVWHGPYENEFAGTSIAVVILMADKA